jgi:DNA-binding MarR family transcriptional regulator
MPRAAQSRAAAAPPLERFITFRVINLAQRFGRGGDLLYGGGFGLSLRQWRVLATLGRFGAVAAQEIAHGAALDKSQVSRAVAELISARLVRQRADSADRRRIQLSLTPQGEALYRAVLPEAQARQARFAAALSPAELKALDAILEKLAAAADREIAALRASPPASARRLRGPKRVRAAPAPP